MWFLRCMFWLRSCQIMFFCLLQFSAVTHISCTMTVNFLWLTFAVWFMTESQTESHSSFFLIIIILMIIRMSLLSSCLTAMILSAMKLFFILFMLSMTCTMRQLQFRVVLLKQIMISSLIRCIRMLCFWSSSDHAERLFCRTAAYVDTAVNCCCFLLIIVIISTVSMSLMTCSLSVMTWCVQEDFIMIVLNSLHHLW